MILTIEKLLQTGTDYLFVYVAGALLFALIAIRVILLIAKKRKNDEKEVTPTKELEIEHTEVEVETTDE